MATDAENKKWQEDLANWQSQNPGGTAQDYADYITSTQNAAAAAAAEAQFGAQMALSEASLALAGEQFDYQKTKDAERLKNIQDSMGQIKNIFGGRQPTYDALRGDSFRLNERRLDELNTDAGRNLNFALARAGNTGGSVEVDKNKELAQKMGLGVGQAEIFAQGQADALKAQDDALKGSLQGLAASGAVGGASMAANARGATRGRSGTAQYVPQQDNTFQGLSNRIGTAQTQQNSGGF